MHFWRFREEKDITTMYMKEHDGKKEIIGYLISRGYFLG